MAKEVSEVNNPARLDSDSSVPINLTIVVVLFEFSAGARGSYARISFFHRPPGKTRTRFRVVVRVTTFRRRYRFRTLLCIVYVQLSLFVFVSSAHRSPKTIFVRGRHGAVSRTLSAASRLVPVVRSSRAPRARSPHCACTLAPELPRKCVRLINITRRRRLDPTTRAAPGARDRVPRRLLCKRFPSGVQRLYNIDVTAAWIIGK